MTREQKFEEALKLIADTFDKNHGRQDEKLLDIPKIARAALSAPKAEAEPVGFVTQKAIDDLRSNKAVKYSDIVPTRQRDHIVPLYTSPVPALTDEAVERAYEAAKNAMPHEALIEIAPGELDRVVRAALLAAFPNKVGE